MRDHSNHFLGAGVQVLEACLAAGENGFLGEGVRVGGEICCFVGERGVDGTEIVLGEFLGYFWEGSAGVAWFVGVFLPVC
jgi:hypothetical protein